MGAYLNDQDLIPDSILCSTAMRARSTVEHLLTTCDVEGGVHYYDELYHADFSVYLEILRRLPPDTHLPMIVGHNPEMDQFLYIVCQEYEHMPTAAVAYISFGISNWTDLDQEIEGRLMNLWKPREI